MHQQKITEALPDSQGSIRCEFDVSRKAGNERIQVNARPGGKLRSKTKFTLGDRSYLYLPELDVCYAGRARAMFAQCELLRTLSAIDLSHVNLDDRQVLDGHLYTRLFAVSGAGHAFAYVTLAANASDLIHELVLTPSSQPTLKVTHLRFNLTSPVEDRLFEVGVLPCLTWFTLL